MMRRLKHFPYRKDRLRRSWLFNLEKRKFCGDLKGTFQYLKGSTGKPERDLLSGAVVIRQGVIEIESGEM